MPHPVKSGLDRGESQPEPLREILPMKIVLTGVSPDSI